MLLTGGIHSDERGRLAFVNDFGLPGVKRFYTITHPDTQVLRAWQGHKRETKHFFVAKGSFLLGWLKPDNWEKPSADLFVNRRVLKAESPAVLTVEPNHVNGFRALSPDSVLIVFSDFSVQESSDDSWRFPAQTWQL